MSSKTRKRVTAIKFILFPLKNERVEIKTPVNFLVSGESKRYIVHTTTKLKLAISSKFLIHGSSIRFFTI